MRLATKANPLAHKYRIASNTALAGPLPARADETISCHSHNFGYRYCRVDTDDRVEMVRQHGFVSGRENRSWGYDRHGVWVDNGCSADFRVGRDRGDNKAAVAGALVGRVALAALASNRQAQAQEQESSEVAAWAVGSFSGFDETESADVQLSILPGGSVSDRAGSSEFTGSLSNTRLQAGRHVFQVQRTGNGFTATDERKASHRVVFRRSSGGY